jgi:hypothetical protein
MAALGIVRGNRREKLEQRSVGLYPNLLLGFELRNADPVPECKRVSARESDPDRFL